MEEVAQKERQALSCMAAVATDGCYFIFVRHWEDGWRMEQLVPVILYTTGQFFRLISSILPGKTLIPKT